MLKIKTKKRNQKEIEEDTKEKSKDLKSSTDLSLEEDAEELLLKKMQNTFLSIEELRKKSKAFKKRTQGLKKTEN